MARPTVMTPEVIAKLEEAFAWGCTDREACLWANISEESLYSYQNKTPGFQSRKEMLKDTPILDSRVTVAKSVKRDARMAMDYLSRKKKDEFSTKSEVDQNNTGELKVTIVNYEDGPNGNNDPA